MTFLLYSLPRDPMAFLSSGFCEEERVRFTGNERTEATFFVPPADLKGLIISMVHVDLPVAGGALAAALPSLASSLPLASWKATATRLVKVGILGQRGTHPPARPTSTPTPPACG
jgi:hypothetical protein